MADLPPGDLSARPPAGQPKDSKEAAPRRLRLRPQPWWLIFLAFMIANYVLTRVFFAEPSSVTVSYTFFKKQVEAGNVETVTSAGDSIRGSFKAAVRYPPQESSAPRPGVKKTVKKMLESQY